MFVGGFLSRNLGLRPALLASEIGLALPALLAVAVLRGTWSEALGLQAIPRRFVVLSLLAGAAFWARQPRPLRAAVHGLAPAAGLPRGLPAPPRRAPPLGSVRRPALGGRHRLGAGRLRGAALPRRRPAGAPSTARRSRVRSSDRPPSSASSTSTSRPPGGRSIGSPSPSPSAWASVFSASGRARSFPRSWRTPFSTRSLSWRSPSPRTRRRASPTRALCSASRSSLGGIVAAALVIKRIDSPQASS